MKIFIDTANIEEIKKYAEIGIIDGVTTNPALIAKEGRDFKDVVVEICKIVNGPISAEVIATDTENMIIEARKLVTLHDNIVVKLPATREGYKALNVIGKEDIKTNFTMIYTANQALLAAKLGATYVSPFVGRLDANSTNGIELIKEILLVYKNFDYSTELLAASMRNSIYVKEAALSGAHVATIPPAVLEDMMFNELTAISLSGFLENWNQLPKEKREYFNK
jgi:transaldolase